MSCCVKVQCGLVHLAAAVSKPHRVSMSTYMMQVVRCRAGAGAQCGPVPPGRGGCRQVEGLRRHAAAEGCAPGVGVAAATGAGGHRGCNARYLLLNFG